jgi:hypothetical protein
MPHVDLDAIMNKITDWDLSLTVDGKKFPINPPTLATAALLEKVKSNGVVIADAKEKIADAIQSLIDPASKIDAHTWSLARLMGAVTAVVEHMRVAAGKNLEGISEAVRAEMRTQTPAAVQKPIPAMDAELERKAVALAAQKAQALQSGASTAK